MSTEEESIKKNTKKRNTPEKTSKNNPVKKIGNSLRKVFLENNAVIKGTHADGDLPKCYGHFVAGHKCECEFVTSCQYYTYDNMGERSRQRKWDNFLSTPLDEKIDWESDVQDNEYAENIELNDKYFDGNGKSYAPSEVDINIIQTYVWLAIEAPETAKALMLKLNPNIKSLQDMADIQGLTKQAIHKRIAQELGVGQRNLRTSLLRLNGKEMEVYKLCISEKKSMREAAKKMKISHTMVQKYMKSIKEKGF